MLSDLVEIKYNWKPHQNFFPFETIQLPERKKKFTELDLPIEFWVLRPDLKCAIIISQDAVLESKLVEVQNKFIKKNELFFQIPLDQCLFVDLSSEK